MPTIICSILFISSPDLRKWLLMSDLQSLAFSRVHTQWNMVYLSVKFQVILSVMLIAAGVLIAALGDFSFDLFGYSMAFISVFFQVIC